MISAKQRKVLRHAKSSTRVLCLAEGAVRSGKTLASTLGFALWTQHVAPHQVHLVVGAQEASVVGNIIEGEFGLEAVLNSLGYRTRLTMSKGARLDVLRPGGRTRYLIVGANNARARRRIMGTTVAGLMLDELALIDQEFFMAAWGRMSLDVAHAWATTNPEGSRHWIRRTILEHPTDYGLEHVKFKMKDNPSLSLKARRRISKGLIGHWRKRWVDGEWADPTGRCFPVWYAGGPPTEITRWTFCMDWASSGVFAALALAVGEWTCVAQERYYDAQVHGYITDEDQAGRTVAWMRGLAGEGRLVLVGDPATSRHFKEQIEQRGIVWIDANNEVLPGIKHTAEKLATRRVVLGDCPRLKDEMAEYVWDEKASARGEDRPVKIKDHGCDALRYGVFTPAAPFAQYDLVGF